MLIGSTKGKLKVKEKSKDIPMNAEFQKIARRDKKTFGDKCKKNRGKQ